MFWNSHHRPRYAIPHREAPAIAGWGSAVAEYWISDDGLDALLATAKANGWSRLCLRGPPLLGPREAASGQGSAGRESDDFFLKSRIETIPPGLLRLTTLRSLDFSGHSIGDEGAKAIAASLPALTNLSLSRNSIGTEGAKAIAASLPALTSLDLDVNSIGTEGAKAIAASLPALTNLYLSRNSIGTEGAKAIAASLPALTNLYLNGNSISTEGLRAILERVALEGGKNRLIFLALMDNPGCDGEWPREIFFGTDARAIAAAYRRYKLGGRQPLNEVKLLVVGREAAGKTSLIRYLTKGLPRDPSEVRTPGIALFEKIEVQGWSPEAGGIRINIWDFGGQEMLKGTHRYFLTDRSLYLLVMDDRRPDDRDQAFEWLRQIRNAGEQSPVIVVINKSDRGKQDLRLDETALRAEFPNIIEFLRTSCDADDWARGSIGSLRARIAAAINQDHRLRHVRDPLPMVWLSIKDRLTGEAKRQSVLPREDFQALCRNSTPPVADEDEQWALLGLLHDLGVVVAHGLTRDAPAVRREVTLLDPNWLTGAIYRILEMAGSVHQVPPAVFQDSDLVGWLDPASYPNHRHRYILDMMLDERIGLCFRLAAPRGGYLVPEALCANRPALPEHADPLRFRYRYEYLPSGLLPRLIVQGHPHLADPHVIWRSGAVFDIQNCKVLVIADRDKKRIDIQVDGPLPRRRAALGAVQADLDAVHAWNPEAKPQARVPLPDQPELDVSYDHLLKLEERSKLDFLPDGADREYKVADLLDGVRTVPAKAPTSGDLSIVKDSFLKSLGDGLAKAALWVIGAVLLFWLAGAWKSLRPFIPV